MSNASNGSTDDQSTLQLAGWLNWPIAGVIALAVTILAWYVGLIGTFFKVARGFFWQSILLVVAIGFILLAIRAYNKHKNTRVSIVLGVIGLVLGVWAVVSLLSAFFAAIGFIFLAYVIGVIVTMDIKCARGFVESVKSWHVMSKVGPTVGDAKKTLMWPITLAGVGFSGATRFLGAEG